MADEADVPEDDVAVTDADAEATEAAEETTEVAEPVEPVTKQPWSHVKLAIAVGLAVMVALAGLTGWLATGPTRRARPTSCANCWSASGRQGAINLTTIDFEHADADVQRILEFGHRRLLRRLRQAVAAVRRRRQAGQVQVGRHGQRGRPGVGERQRGQRPGGRDRQDGKRRNAEPAAAQLADATDRQEDGADQAKVSKVEFVP